MYMYCVSDDSYFNELNAYDDNEKGTRATTASVMRHSATLPIWACRSMPAVMNSRLEWWEST